MELKKQDMEQNIRIEELAAQKIEKQAQVESDFLANVATVFIGAGIGKTSVETGKLVVEGSKKVAKKGKDKVDDIMNNSVDIEMKVIFVNGNQVELTKVGSKGSWDKLVNKDLKPDTAYQLDNGHTYITNTQGKVNYVEADLSKIKADRNNYQQNVVGKSGELNDQGGHLIASTLGGAGDRINLVPMDKVLNNGAYKKMESDLVKALNEGKNVSVTIDVGYPDGGGVRPNSFTVTATIDGVVKKLPPFKQ